MPHKKLHRHIKRVGLVHVDETSWRERNEGCWLWVACTTAVAFFLVQGRRTGDAAKKLLGDAASRLVGRLEQTRAHRSMHSIAPPITALVTSFHRIIIAPPRPSAALRGCHSVGHKTTRAPTN